MINKDLFAKFRYLLLTLNKIMREYEKLVNIAIVI